jgi:hypothetical protein
VGVGVCGFAYYASIKLRRELGRRPQRDTAMLGSRQVWAKAPPSR